MTQVTYKCGCSCEIPNDRNLTLKDRSSLKRQAEKMNCHICDIKRSPSIISFWLGLITLTVFALLVGIRA